MKFRTSLLLAVFSGLLAAPKARSAVSFVFDYSDPSSASWSPEAKAALKNAGERVASYFSAYTATLTIAITSYHDPVSYAYADAGTNWNLTGGNPGFQNPGVVGVKIRSNGAIDQNGPVADGYINVNMGDWYGYSDSVEGSVADFTSLMMHELGHGIGFFSNLAQDGSVAFNGYFVPYCEFMSDSTGDRIVKFNSVSGLWEVNMPLWLKTSTGGGDGGGLYFNGPNAMAANGGKPVALHSPEIWLEGASQHHLDMNNFPDALMNAYIFNGPRTRVFSDVEIGMLRDIGYTITVPEPGGALLTLLGLGAGAAARRRRAGVEEQWKS